MLTCVEHANRKPLAQELRQQIQRLFDEGDFDRLRRVVFR
jgi:hypothetical protein